MKEMEKLLKNNIIDITTLMRFPLIVIVVMIHTCQDADNFAIQGRPFGEGFGTWYFALLYWMAESFGRLAVPCFFAISGYLFFYGVKQFGIDEYGQKVKRRIWSLLIPYVLWTLLMMAWTIIKSFPALHGIYPNAAKEVHDIQWFILSFWGNGTCPLLYPFWYVRDLMVTVVLTPLIYMTVKRGSRVWFPLLAFLTIWGGKCFPTGLSPSSVMYFSIGAWFSIHGLTTWESRRWHAIFPIIYIPLSISDTLLRSIFTLFIPLLHPMCIFFGFATVFIAARWLSNHGVVMSRKLTSSVFFIFAAHAFILGDVKKVLFVVCNPHTEWASLLLHFSTIIIVVLICVTIYRLMYRVSPRLTHLLCGR